MDAKEKQLCKYRLGLTIRKIIESNQSEKNNKLPVSLRQLAASSSTEYSIIQKVAAGKKDPQFTTLAAIIDGLKISFNEFAGFYDAVPTLDVVEYQKEMERHQKVGAKLKPILKKSSPAKK